MQVKGLFRIERSFGRNPDSMRPVTMERNVLKHAPGSCLVSFGDTKILCAATIEERVSSWRRGSGKGWVTAEYAMLPASTSSRTARETHGKQGRSQEIQRLVGRSLRSVCDMGALGGEVTVTVDCDVIQADGGTRTASVTGGWVALHDALATWKKAGKIRAIPLTGQVAAISVGMVDGDLLCDLDYMEDSRAEIDLNLVGTEDGRLIEVQGTGERTPFSRQTLDKLLDMGQSAIAQLIEVQRQAIGGQL